MNHLGRLLSFPIKINSFSLFSLPLRGLSGDLLPGDFLIVDLLFLIS